MFHKFEGLVAVIQNLRDDGSSGLYTNTDVPADVLELTF